MTAISKASAKAYFETGDIPTQAEFADLIDSYQDAAANLGTLTSANLGTVGLQLLSATTSASAVNHLGAGTVGAQLFRTVTTAEAQAIIGASSTVSAVQVFDSPGMFLTPANGTYTIIPSIGFAGTMIGTTTVSESGTCNAMFKINGSAMNGGANAVSSAKSTVSRVSTFVSGADISIEVSGNSSCSKMSFNLIFSRTLA